MKLPAIKVVAIADAFVLGDTCPSRPQVVEHWVRQPDGFVLFNVLHQHFTPQVIDLVAGQEPNCSVYVRARACVHGESEEQPHLSLK